MDTANAPTKTPVGHLRILLILSALMSFASISTDLYLPAIPTLGAELHATSGNVEWTISAFLVGFSLGQLIWGPLGDRLGRRAPIAMGLVLFVVGSVGCALSQTLWQMMAWRIVQAVGACAGPVLARAMVRDLYARDQAARMLSTLITIMGAAPLVGPLLGGQILQVWSWHAIFWLLAAVGTISLISMAVLPETLPREGRVTEPMRRVFKDYFNLARDRRLIRYAASGGFFYGGAYAFIAGTPSVYIDYFGVSPQTYGLLFGVNIIGIMVANLLNARFVTRVGSERMFLLGTQVAALAGAVMALDTWFGWGALAGIAVPVFFFMAMNGLIVANSVAGALASFPHKAGAASSLVGAIHYGSGIISAGLVGGLSDGSPWTMGCIIGVSGIGCLIMAMAPIGRPELSLQS